MANLKIFYTIPYLVPLKEKDLYEVYLSYSIVAKMLDIPFEMISFQESPGRFLTDRIIYQKLTEIGDAAFPVTILNDEFVKCSSLPTLEEFSKWFEALENISYESLVQQAEKIEKYQFPTEEEIIRCSMNSCSACASSDSCGVAYPDFEY